MISLALLVAASASVNAAHHDGTLEGDLVVWHSEIDALGPGRIDLRVPLSGDVTVIGAREVRARGALVALDIDSGPVRIDIVTKHPRGKLLAPPLIADSVERVLFTDGHVISAPIAERRIGFSATPDVDLGMRTQVAQRFGVVGPASAPLYLGPTTTLPEGLRASLHTPGDGRVRASVAVGVVAGLLVGALIFVVRMLARRAALERAERVLDAELRAFDAR